MESNENIKYQEISKDDIIKTHDRKQSSNILYADLSGNGAQVIEENGRPALTFWPYCTECRSPFQFDAEEPFAYCSCGATEWGDPRPASWVCPPRQPLNEEDTQRPKGAPAAQQGEPFGYFRAEPFGWTDCAEGDEGAVALYEKAGAARTQQEER